MSKKTLYERLGGYDAISAVANDLLPRLRQDPQLARFWQHAYRERLSTEFLAALSVEKREAMRPERAVQGAPEARAHAGLRLSRIAGVKR